MNLKILTFGAIVTLLQSLLVHAQNTDAQLTEEIRMSVMQELDEQVLNNYVFEKVAEQIHDSLTFKQEFGGYSQIVTYSEFANSLMADIQTWSGDLHFFIYYAGIPLDPTSLIQRSILAPKIEFLEGDVAYISNIEKLSDNNINVIEGLIIKAIDAKALIIDLRECKGGDRKAIGTLSSYFFEKPIHLVSYQERGRKPKKEMTIRKINTDQLHAMPIYILTSKRTASGGESLAYLLKQHGRAITVGDTTMGAAHIVKTFDLTNNFRAFIPYIRPIHPKTGQNWENIGVIPDIQVSDEMILEKVVELIQSGK